MIRSNDIYTYNGITLRGRILKTNDSFVDSNGLKFKPISTAEFLERKRTLGRKNFVDAPWTIE